MNANELADLLHECIKDGSTDLVCVEQAATMLRQQKEEIDMLKKLLDAFGITVNRKAQEK
jgi:hypothetical protein